MYLQLAYAAEDDLELVMCQECRQEAAVPGLHRAGIEASCPLIHRPLLIKIKL